MEWGRQDVRTQPEQETPQGQAGTFPFLTASNPPALMMQVSFGRNSPLCHTEKKKKKGDKDGLQHTFILVALEKL